MIERALMPQATAGIAQEAELISNAPGGTAGEGAGAERIVNTINSEESVLASVAKASALASIAKALITSQGG